VPDVVGEHATPQEVWMQTITQKESGAVPKQIKVVNIVYFVGGAGRFKPGVKVIPSIDMLII